MITVILLHPLQSTPVQSWTFTDQPLIRVGRATDNQVVLYSAVVSRRHLEIREVDGNWEIVSLGTNGTYLEGKRISQVPVVDGVILRLANSGPQLQIRLGITLEEGITSQQQPLAPPEQVYSKQTFTGGSEESESN